MAMRRTLLFVVLAVVVFCVGCDERHKARIYKTKKHHFIMQDDRSDWFTYTIDDSGPTAFNRRGEMVLPRGGGWRQATQEEEEEVTVEGQAINEEETTVEESEAGAPDADGNVGGDEGGTGDSGGDGGDGGGDGGGDDGD